MYRIFLSLLICQFCANAAQARLWRVNNTLGVAADFTSVASAVNAALDNDTIYVEPSATIYDNINTVVNISRRITLIGNGSFLAAPGHTGLQINTNDSYFGCSQLTFSSGSAGSAIYGMRISGNINLSTGVDNITIRRCRFNTCTISGTGNNHAILENWCAYFSRSASAGQAQSGLLIKNNIFTSTNVGIAVGVDDAAVIENNTCMGGLNMNFATRVFVFNNILTISSGTVVQNQSGVSDAFKNNISSDASLPSGNGNLTNVTMVNVFSVYPFTGNNDTDARLRTGSVALNAGMHGNGDDIGAYNDGINRPSYILGLIPPFPSIYGLSGVGIVNTPNMNVTISARANN